MKEHYNLYYLLLQDKQSHAMEPRAALRIRKVVTATYQGKKPPWRQAQGECNSCNCPEQKL